MSIPVTATPKDIYQNLMGSAWETWDWWREVNDDVIWNDVPEDWKVTGRVDDPQEPESEDTPTIEFEITNAALVTALLKISDSEELHLDLRRKCLLLLLDPDSADFDAADSDYVIQVALFDQAIYG